MTQAPDPFRGLPGGPSRAPRRLPLLAWDAPLYCHAPLDEPFDPSELADAGDHSDRWCRPGQPTAYLASDPGVAIAELARHQPPRGGGSERRILRLDPGPRGLGGLVDLRDGGVLRALGVTRPLTAFLDRERARAVADRVRADERHAGLLVPSMAFLDDPARANVVLFAERLGDLADRLQASSEVARVVIADA